MQDILISFLFRNQVKPRLLSLIPIWHWSFVRHKDPFRSFMNARNSCCLNSNTETEDKAHFKTISHGWWKLPVALHITRYAYQPTDKGLSDLFHCSSTFLLLFSLIIFCIVIKSQMLNEVSGATTASHRLPTHTSHHTTHSIVIALRAGKAPHMAEVSNHQCQLSVSGALCLYRAVDSIWQWKLEREVVSNSRELFMMNKNIHSWNWNIRDQKYWYFKTAYHYLQHVVTTHWSITATWSVNLSFKL